MEFVWGEVAFHREPGVIIGVIGYAGGAGVVCSTVEVRLEPVECRSEIEGRVRRAYTEVQSKAKQCPECWGRLHGSGEVVYGEIPRSLEVIPGRHVSKCKSGILFD